MEKIIYYVRASFSIIVCYLGYIKSHANNSEIFRSQAVRIEKRFFKKRSSFQISLKVVLPRYTSEKSLNMFFLNFIIQTVKLFNLSFYTVNMHDVIHTALVLSLFFNPLKGNV